MITYAHRAMISAEANVSRRQVAAASVQFAEKIAIVTSARFDDFPRRESAFREERGTHVKEAGIDGDGREKRLPRSEAS